MCLCVLMFIKSLKICQFKGTFVEEFMCHKISEIWENLHTKLF